MGKNIFGYSELQKAYELALDNAEQLCRDATLLCDNASYPRAYTLYQLSREESGKCLMLQQAMLYNALGVQIDFDWLSRMGFVDHVSKTRNSLGLENVFISFVEQFEGVELKKLHEDIEMAALNIKDTDKMKNASLYVGFNGNKFISPKQIISEGMVSDISISAQVSISAAKVIRWTEEGLIKMVDYLKQSSDPIKHEMIGRLKEILRYRFKNNEAEIYCQQIGSALGINQ